MKTHTKLGYIIFLIGIFVFVTGMGRLTGSLDYNSFISNKFVALLVISIGISVIFISFFIKPRSD